MKKAALDDDFYIANGLFAQHYAAKDWFNELSENPELKHRRVGHQGRLLPVEFGLFDDLGRPIKVQFRQSWLQLADLAILKQQP